MPSASTHTTRSFPRQVSSITYTHTIDQQTPEDTTPPKPLSFNPIHKPPPAHLIHNKPHYTIPREARYPYSTRPCRPDPMRSSTLSRYSGFGAWGLGFGLRGIPLPPLPGPLTGTNQIRPIYASRYPLCIHIIDQSESAAPLVLCLSSPTHRTGNEDVVRSYEEK
ncbi:uncharacterized protein BO80DRAFT_220055 [Aspergillus ibericus CBS 121593]|uniref:Uncharacterized protein n=1 Tax=Aspergillus ibericus CBS 121593 TaxID=1448316 RepID=A0A395GMJ9_9EURO|nr:hypothetical protein BO80DRAFT_220055 [Aspergillus ibericus CBS 121593]RAK96614.1 hypothetical protein BO80DRAFT_220055 [Aspergillus ibericus CBS 121593]